MFGLRKPLDLAFSIRGPDDNTLYSSSKPNESDIVLHMQCGGDKLKYVLKFYIGGTGHMISRMRNDNATNVYEV